MLDQVEDVVAPGEAYLAYLPDPDTETRPTLSKKTVINNPKKSLICLKFSLNCPQVNPALTLTAAGRL